MNQDMTETGIDVRMPGLYQNLRNVGKIEDADGMGVVGYSSCHNMMMVTIKVSDGWIEDIKFKTFGCGLSIAETSIVIESIKGKTIEEALRIVDRGATDTLGVSPFGKRHCSLLAEEAIKAAVEDYWQRVGGKA